MKKKLLCAALLATACGGSKYVAPPSVPSVSMPAGAQLKPFDPAKPGEARAQGLAELNGKVWVTLANIDPANYYAPAGPGFLASIFPATGALELIDLGGANGKQCLNPGSVRVFGANLYVTCGGASDGTGAAVVELNTAGTVTRAVAMPSLSSPFPHTLVPYTLTATETKLWVGDAYGDTVRAIDRGAFTFTSDTVALGCPMGHGDYPYNTVADLQIVDGDLYGLCGADVGGTSTLSRLDAATGALKQAVNVGPIPTAAAAVGDGRIAVLNSNDNTLMLVTPKGTTLEAHVALTFSSQTSLLQDLRSRDGFLYTTASGSNTVQKIDPNWPGGAKVVGEVNVGQGASPYNILPLDDAQALVSNLLGNSVVSVRW